MNESMPVAGRQRTRRKNAGGPRGRRALCWVIGLFALSQAALSLWVPHDGFFLRDPVRRARLGRLRRQMAEAPSPPRLVVLLGSSHIYYSLFSRRLGLQASADLGRPVVVANEAMPGTGPIRSLLVMDRLLREGVVPDLVVLETFPLGFDDRRDETGSDLLPVASLDAGDVALLRRYAPDRSDLAGGRGPDAVAPVYLQRANLTNFFLPWLLVPGRRNRPLPEEHDFGREDLSDGRRARALAEVKKAYAPLHDAPIGGFRQCMAVAELIERVRAKGAKVVFLATPEGPTFRSWYPPVRWAESVVWLRDLAARHGVPLVDARRWTDDEELFGDSHHLTRAGSEQFSRWVGREILVPQLRAGR